MLCSVTPGVRSRSDPVKAGDLDGLADLDAQAFGAQRQALLAYLLANQPGQAWLARYGKKILGFVLARAGRLASHIGPLVAETDDVAEAVLRKSLEGATGPVSIDVPDHQSTFASALTAAGFYAGTAVHAHGQRR